MPTLDDATGSVRGFSCLVGTLVAPSSRRAVARSDCEPFETHDALIGLPPLIFSPPVTT